MKVKLKEFDVNNINIIETSEKKFNGNKLYNVKYSTGILTDFPKLDSPKGELKYSVQESFQFQTPKMKICKITNEDYENLRETTCALIEKYVFLNMIQYMQPNFHDTVCKDVTSLLKYTIKQM